MKDEEIPKLECLRISNIAQVPDSLHYQLLKFLNDNPELIYNILSHDDLQDQEASILFDFFINLYYGSTITERKTEDYILALFYCFLDDAFKNVTEDNVEEIFNKKVGYFFKNLYKLKHIKEYFLNILNYEFKTIEFNNNGKWLFEEMKKIDENNAKIIEEELEKYKNTMGDVENKIFTQKFTLNMNEFDEKINELEKKDKKENYDKYEEFIENKLLSQIRNNKEAFLMNEVIEIFNSNDSKDNFYLHYTFSIYITYRCVKNILLDLGNSYKEIPNLIKYILKIIQIFIEKKKEFKRKKEILHSIVKKFFFDDLLVKLNTFPYFELIYEENVISEETKEKTEIINKIIKQFIEGQFYSGEEIIYSPLNMLFFKKKLKKVYEIFDDDFYKKIELPTNIKEFMKKKDWNVLSNNDKEKSIELSYCCYNLISKLLIETIEKLKKAEIKTFEIETNKFFQNIVKKQTFNKDHFYICQEITFPFEVVQRQIKCFNKEDFIKKKKKRKRKRQ